MQGRYILAPTRRVVTSQCRCYPGFPLSQIMATSCLIQHCALHADTLFEPTMLYVLHSRWTGGTRRRGTRVSRG